MVVLLREGRVADFNRRRAAGEKADLRGCNLRGLDLRELDVTAGLDLSNAYLRQADLRGLNLAKCRLEGASLHAAHVSGVLFPAELEATEIEMSVRLGTRLRHRR
ncbi:MAG: pentapeptide repeat-containing protein [Proteobacteria bacterium]|nr:pentapeptide repeat-containing protein [Pseudomonadota bacterium]